MERFILKKAAGLEEFSLPQAPDSKGRSPGGEDLGTERIRQALL